MSFRKISRSYRKTPHCGITTAATDATGKRQLKRRLRHRNKIYVSTGLEPVDRNMLYDPWNLDKDGKQRFDPCTHPELLRK